MNKLNSLIWNALNQYTEISHPSPGWLVQRGSAKTEASVTIDGQPPTVQAGELWHDEKSVDNSAGAVRRVTEITATRPTGGVNNGPVTTRQNGSRFIPPPVETIMHDDDGNQTVNAQWTYTWDGENRLIAAEENTSVHLQPSGTTPVKRQRLEFAYDAQGRRISKRVLLAEAGSTMFVLKQGIVFLYDGWNMVAEIDITQTEPRLLRSYEWGLDVSGPMEGAGGVGGLLVERFHSATSSSAYAPCYDGNGNVVALADGAVMGRYEYGAFGETIRVEGGAVVQANPVRFSTKYWDGETGLLYYTHRYYSPDMGRWLNRDPIEEQGGINLYGFVGNDPVNRWDYLGLDERTLVVAMGPDIGEGISISEQNPSVHVKPIIPILRQQLGYLPSAVNFSRRKPIRDEAFIRMKAEQRIAKYQADGMRPIHTVKFLFKYTATTAEVQGHLPNQGDRHILMAHGSPAPVETGLIFEVPGAMVLNKPIAAPYPLSRVLSADFKPVDNKLGVACCFPGKLPKKVRDIELVRLAANPNANTEQMAGPSINLIVDVWMCLLGFTESK